MAINKCGQGLAPGERENRSPAIGESSAANQRARGRGRSLSLRERAGGGGNGPPVAPKRLVTPGNPRPNESSGRVGMALRRLAVQSLEARKVGLLAQGGLVHI